MHLQIKKQKVFYYALSRNEKELLRAGITVALQTIGKLSVEQINTLEAFENLLCENG